MQKVETLRRNLDESEGFLVTSRANVRYLSGFAGEGFLIITQTDALLVTDFRYLIDASRFEDSFRIRNISDGLSAIMPKYLKRLYIEGDHMTYSDYLKYQAEFAQIEFVNDEGKITKLRRVKTEDEINAIKKACDIANSAFEAVLSCIKVGVSERDIALEIEYMMRKSGAEGVSFETIAASGENSACPHAVPSDRKIQNGDFLTLDFGCIYNGYCSDMTRTVVIGSESERHIKIYNLVLKAQLAALDVIRPGMVCSEVDAVARNIIAQGGHGADFGHSLGHSVGLQIHEAPNLSPKSRDILEEGMVITVEPGIYVKGFGGVRIEDLVVVRQDKPQILTKAKKDLLIL